MPRRLTAPRRSRLQTMGRAYLIGLAAVVTAVAFAGPAHADLSAVSTVAEPYGTQSVDTNATGTGTTTQDIGCAPLGIVARDFTLALATGAATPDGSVGPFIMWDAGAPAGYVGTPATAHTVIGSPTGN